MTSRLFLTVLGMESRRAMSYRVDFWLQVVASFAVNLTVAYFVWHGIFQAADHATGSARIGGYDEPGMLVYYVVALLVSRLVRGTERPATLAGEIYDGSLSRFLLYPAGYLRMKYAEHLGTLLPAFIQLGLGSVLVVAVFGRDAPALAGVSPGSIARAAVAVAVANLLQFLLNYPLQAVAFWADNVWSLQVMLRFAADLLGGLMLPLAIFPATAQSLLGWLPFPYLFSFPVTVLLGQTDGAQWLAGITIGLAWCAIAGGIGHLIWQRGLRTYSGVGI
jgi:ABC-2 type transport system permease protein